jgi:hypothetical protein
VAIAIRSGAPANFNNTGTATVGGTLTGAQQPQAADVLIIIHCNDFYASSAMPTPTVGGSTTGVTAISGGSFSSSSVLGSIKSYYYVVGSTGDLAVSVTESAPGDEEKNLIVYVLSGADTSTVIDGTAASGNDTSSQSNQIAPSVTPSASNSYLICHINTLGGSGGGSYTPPSGMTETVDAVTGGVTSVTNAIQQLAASGATGTKTFVSSGAAPYQAMSFAVLTASSSRAPGAAGGASAGESHPPGSGYPAPTTGPSPPTSRSPPNSSTRR